MVPLDKKIPLQRIPAIDGPKSNDNDDAQIININIYKDLLEDEESIKAKDTKKGQILHSGTDPVNVIQKSLETLSPDTGGVISISDGYYHLESNNIVIPDINNLTIQGNSPTGNAIFDATNIHTPGLHDPRYVGIFSRSTEDSRNHAPLNHINNLTIRNLTLIGSQTGKGYLANDLTI